MAERIQKEDFEEKVLRSGLPVLVDFYSDSCIACKKLAPVLGQLEKTMENRFVFYKVNTNYQADLAQKYRVLSNPTLIVFKNGQEVARKTGADKLKEVENWLNEF